MARLIPLIGAAIAALVIGGGAGWYFGFASAPRTVIVAEEKPHITEYTIKDRIVNLADQGGRRYLKVSMIFQVAESTHKAQASDAPGGTLVFTGYEATSGGGAVGPGTIPNTPQVQDAITVVLSSKRSDELMSNDGKERLREELKAKVNTVMPAGQSVVKVFFTDFIIQ
jgi:flagellar basal body-associated protein FliL